MINKQHPIAPPSELVEQWYCNTPLNRGLTLATQAAQWGADQELEACCKWLPKLPPWSADDLRRHRRPKPPSLAEQATAELDNAVMRGDCVTTTDAMPLLRAAIKRLAELDTTAHYSP